MPFIPISVLYTFNVLVTLLDRTGHYPWMYYLHAERKEYVFINVGRI